jgi:hypothetical protein
MKLKDIVKILSKVFTPPKKGKVDIVGLTIIVVLAFSASALMLHEAFKPMSDGTSCLALMPSDFAALTVDFGDGTIRTFRGEVVAGMTPIDALLFASKSANLDLSYSMGQKPISVTSIGGKGAGKKGNWVFYINGAKGDDPTQYSVSPGDEIIWKFEKPASARSVKG